jgi:Zn-finger nucleic acid-binding protein
MSEVRSSIGLLCPACKVDLVMAERKDVEIDYCPKCRGVWLDRGELDKIIEKSAAVEMQQRAPTAQPHQPHPATAGYGERGERGEHGERGEYGEHGGRGYGYRRKSWLAEIFD